ncbi:MAG: quinone-dependent dihydroorotate dehydrogenase [Alphaproteobacteria bacterium]
MDLSSLALPLIRALNPDRAHALTLRALALGLGPAQREADDPILRTGVLGLNFPNPLGLAAGFDKNARVFAAMLRAGLGFVEVGTVTPRPQEGNPRPRIFRLTQDEAVINRLGFNNEGMAAAARRLEGRGGGVVGVNIGKNRDTDDDIADYATAARRLGPLADYVVVNVSSPNTPGLRALQNRETLAGLVDAVAGALAQASPAGAPPLLVKIAPDLDERERDDIAAVACSGPVAGLVIGNTTIGRPAGLSSPSRAESGGLSGRPLFGPSTRLLSEMYRLTGGKVVLIGVGGIATGADAYKKIRAGASLTQYYTSLIYRGAGMIPRVKRELAALLRAGGFESVAGAVGADHR